MYDDDEAPLERHAPGHPYERIRKLLVRVGQGLRTPERANQIHSEMRRLGFWDRDEPFPADRERLSRLGGFKPTAC